MGDDRRLTSDIADPLMQVNGNNGMGYVEDQY